MKKKGVTDDTQAIQEGAEVKAKLSVVDFSTIRPDQNNANRHTERGEYMVGESVEQHGVAEAGTLDANNNLIGGNLRTRKFAEVLDPEKAIVVETDGQTPVYLKRTDIDLNTEAGRRLAYALNRTAQVSINFDPTQLAADIDSGLDLANLFFEEELEALLQEADHENTKQLMQARIEAGTEIAEAQLLELVEKWGTNDGQVWQLGQHRLLIGDSTNEANVRMLLDGETPILMVTDPPYGVDYDPTWRVLVRDTDNEKKFASVTNDDRKDWREAFKHFVGDIIYLWHAGVYSASAQAQLESAGFAIVSQIIWVKEHFSIGRGDYHWQHEPCWYAVRKGQTHNWQGSRSEATTWFINRNDDHGHGHSTQKPVETYLRPVANNTRTGQRVYDPFVGSGTLFIACEQLQRVGYGMEIDPRFAAVTLERFSLSFPDVAIERVKE